jgi:hypothetical protein
MDDADVRPDEAARCVTDGVLMMALMASTSMRKRRSSVCSMQMNAKIADFVP